MFVILCLFEIRIRLVELNKSIILQASYQQQQQLTF